MQTYKENYSLKWENINLGHILFMGEITSVLHLIAGVDLGL